MDEEEDHTVGGWGQRAACIGATCMMTFNKGAMPPKSYSGYNNWSGRMPAVHSIWMRKRITPSVDGDIRAACIGAACMMTFNKGAMPPKSYSGYNNPTTPIHRPFDMDEEEDHTVGGWGQRAACIGAACMMTFNKGAMPPKSYSGYNNPTTPIHRPFDMDEEEDHTVGGWGQRAACIGAACMMTFNKLLKSYSGYNNPTTPIHRPFDMDEEEDHTVGGWGQRAACIGAACMMTFNKGAMPPKSYSGYNNPTTPIHRPF